MLNTISRGVLAIVFLAASAFAQFGSHDVLYVPTAPSGSCLAGSRIQQVTTGAGPTYTCQSITAGVGTWASLGGGGGTGTVTSVGLNGTADQIIVTGASPITTTGSWTLSVANPFILPSNGSVGAISLGCSGSDQAVGSGVAWVAPFGCTPYNLIPPATAGSGFFRGSNSANKVTFLFQNAIDLSADVVNLLPVANGGTGSASGSGALLNLFPAIIRNGDIICAAGSIWTTCPNTGGNTGTPAFLTENSGGTVGWVQVPIPVIDGGTGLTTMTLNTVYKGNTTSGMLPTAMVEAAGTLTISEALSVTGHVTFESVTSTGATGTGNLVFATSPTFVTPALGTPASGVLTNAIGLPLSGLTTQAADTLVANATGGSASPTAVAFPTTGTNGCDGTTDTLTYNTSTHLLKCHQITAGAVSLSSLTAASAANTLTNGNNPQTWNFAQTTNSQDAMTFGETSAATNGTLTNGLANQSELHASTASGSTATPFEVDQGSVTGTTAFPAMQIETTWNNAGLTGMGLLFNVTDTLSSTGGILAQFNVGNVFQFKLDKVGNETLAGGLTAGSFVSTPAGSVTGATYIFTGDTANAGMYRPAAVTYGFTNGTNEFLRLQNGSVKQNSGGCFGMTSSSTSSTGSFDTGMDRAAAGTIRFDANSSCNDGLGKAQAGNYTTTANCSSSASPAVCAAAAAGSVAVPTGTNPTLTVNTTAVTANSQIFVQSDDTLGTKLSVTCNSTLTSLAVEPVVTTRTAATSFVITINGVISTNPVCLSYFIVN